MLGNAPDSLAFGGGFLHWFCFSIISCRILPSRSLLCGPDSCPGVWLRGQACRSHRSAFRRLLATICYNPQACLKWTHVQPFDTSVCAGWSYTCCPDVITASLCSIVRGGLKHGPNNNSISCHTTLTVPKWAPLPGRSFAPRLQLLCCASTSTQSF